MEIKLIPRLNLVKLLPDEIAGAQIIKLEIPTICHQSLKVIDEAIAKYDPDVVLSSWPGWRTYRLSQSKELGLI